MAASTYLTLMAGNRWTDLHASAISLAVAFSGVADSTSDQQDVGLAMLALRALKARDEAADSQFPQDFGVLMTDEIERLLGHPKTGTKFGSGVIKYTQPTGNPFTGGEP